MSDEHDLDELARELELDDDQAGSGGHTREEARVIAGFEEIMKFVHEHGHAPEHGQGRDIFERLYAVRLDRLRALRRFRPLLQPFDKLGLLGAATDEPILSDEELGDEALLEELEMDSDAVRADDVTQLKHVKPRAEVRAAEEIGERTKCDDFELFEPLFNAIRQDLKGGLRKTRRYAKMAGIKQGEFFIINGQMAYVADVGKEFETEYDRRDSRLRVIYDNGTESDILLRSLQRALHRDDSGRRITDPLAGPLFAEGDDDD
ncbi:conserved protein of unknown function [Bradyrhizobium sp. ORS 285]|uniref:hypothetical protein n=1 Tax=Bradyrhizobium sp. ORS 285 TaxID=115808 RepID=UPI0002407E61|nr:conserved hypothetical protein [Bradyrhizobium sp. ORS 285]SMX61030.1 conserved protein of unknown function [Bradyrhizobium sp. ORS 285]